LKIKTGSGSHQKIFKLVELKKFLIVLLISGIAIAAFSSRRFFEPERLVIPSSEIQKQWMKAQPEISSLKSGDLIFRHGRGFISNALMSLGQREKKYSHAGIISVENGNVYVYHAIGGEQNISNKLRKDKLEDFCSPQDVHAFGIYRSDLDKEQIEAVIDAAKIYFKCGLEFDTKFDLTSNDKMYCTEFIYKIFNGISGNQNYIYLSAAGGNQYVSCDDLYLNPHFKKIYSFAYTS
jgi:hypothetical protein